MLLADGLQGRRSRWQLPAPGLIAWKRYDAASYTFSRSLWELGQLKTRGWFLYPQPAFVLRESDVG